MNFVQSDLFGAELGYHYFECFASLSLDDIDEHGQEMYTCEQEILVRKLTSSWMTPEIRISLPPTTMTRIDAEDDIILLMEPDCRVECTIQLIRAPVSTTTFSCCMCLF